MDLYREILDEIVWLMRMLQISSKFLVANNSDMNITKVAFMPGWGSVCLHSTTREPWNGYEK